MQQRRVVCAAIRNQKGHIICSARHYDPVMHAQIRNSSNPEDWKPRIEQGFIDQFGTFLTREEAHKIAIIANQIRRRVGGDDERLFSENLY